MSGPNVKNCHFCLFRKEMRWLYKNCNKNERMVVETVSQGPKRGVKRLDL